MTTFAVEGVGLAVLWRLLSLGFAPPADDTLVEVEALAEALIEAGAPPEVDDLLAALGDAEPEDLATEHAALFRGKVRVAPYEGSYEIDPLRQGRQMADVAAFYRAFGAEAHGPSAERPDFVGCELEFLSFLELRRLVAVEAGEEGIDLVEEIRAGFLEDHAGRWLPTFFADVAAAEPSPYYAALAALGARVIAEEVERRGVTPSSLPHRTRRTSVEGDELECGSAASPGGRSD